MTNGCENVKRYEENENKQKVRYPEIYIQRKMNWIIIELKEVNRLVESIRTMK
jgi:hypothetical protein